jgi:hypothetical protein
MRSLVLLAITITPLGAAPALAQFSANSFSTSNRDTALPVGPGNFSFRINEVVGQDGARRQRRSLIAGVEVAPDTTIGIGLFDTLPKARGRGPDPRLDGLSKRSRKAAVGMTFRF